MAEASSTETPAKKKKAKARSPEPATPPPEGGGLLTAWRSWAVIGVLLVGGVVAWKLLGSSYKSDVETICNAEKGSGFTIEHDPSKVTQWVRAHLATPEGNELYSGLGEMKVHDRGKRLQSTADELKVGACPAVASYEKVAADGDYKTDLQRLCSNVTFPKLAELDDAARLAALEEWIDKNAKSPRTKELADPLRQGGPPERAKLLRDTANKENVYTCDVAKTLEAPVAPPKGKGAPTVRPYAAPQINGGLAAEDLAKGLAEVTPAMNECYKAGLAKKPDLEFKMAVKMKVDPAGKVSGAMPAEPGVPDREVTECILKAIKSMKLPAPSGPLVTVFVPLELTTTAVEAPPGAAPSGVAPPGGH